MFQCLLGMDSLIWEVYVANASIAILAFPEADTPETRDVESEPDA
jgi:hypothetical protein